MRKLIALVTLLCAAPVLASDRPELPRLTPQEKAEPAPAKEELWVADKKWIAVGAAAAGLATAVAIVVALVLVTPPKQQFPFCDLNCR